MNGSRSSARPATRARWRARCCTATRTSSWPTSPPARTPASGSTASTRARASRSRSRPTTPTATPTSTPPSSRTRTAPPRRWSPSCARRGVRVVDLSADFRLADRAVYEEWYGEHGAPELLGSAVYGLPERNRAALADADLVAGPGCYPTAAILALAPLAQAGVLGDVVIDAKSGVSGAGREPSAGKHFVAVDETVTPYKVGRHRHTPEIEEQLGGGVRITFTPHLVPLSYGELVSCYVTPARAADVGSLYAQAYDDEPWVEVVEGPPGMHEVRETNFCRISHHADDRTGRIIVFATIDNLWKGTSSQAVQSLNLMFGRDEREGLA